MTVSIPQGDDAFQYTLEEVSKVLLSILALVTFTMVSYSSISVLRPGLVVRI
jgi:hypothetical protein